MSFVTMSLVIDLSNAGRLDRIVQGIAGCSRSQLRGLFDHGCVSVNGESCTDIRALANVGDQVLVCFDPHRRYGENKKAWRDGAFSIVFEDRHLIVVEKAAELLTVPTERGETNTLVDRVSRYLRQNQGIRQAIAVQRLDRGVSGLVVLGKSRDAANRLIRLFRKRKPTRRYVALVQGTVTPTQGTFQSHLATAKNLDRYSTEAEDEGELAITHYQVSNQFAEFALVDVHLETGRRNQIRVHFAEAGHPILGDERYGRGRTQSSAWTPRRLALHAASLAFEHPFTGKTLAFESPMPAEMMNLISPNHQ